MQTTPGPVVPLEHRAPSPKRQCWDIWWAGESCRAEARNFILSMKKNRSSGNETERERCAPPSSSHSRDPASRDTKSALRFAAWRPAEIMNVLYIQMGFLFVNYICCLRNKTRTGFETRRSLLGIHAVAAASVLRCGEGLLRRAIKRSDNLWRRTSSSRRRSNAVCKM